MEWIKTKKENHPFFMIRVNEQVQDFEWAMSENERKNLEELFMDRISSELALCYKKLCEDRS